MRTILHSRPWLTEEDRCAVLATLTSESLGQGEKTRAFERAMSDWVGVEEGGVAVGSGSAALLLALKALEIGPGDEVVIPTYVCRSVLEAVLTAGAKPVCCDVGPEWVVTPANVSAHLGSRTRALVLPHLYGVFADVRAFRRFGLPIVEDCAQAVDRRGRRKLEGDVGVFSFHPTKCLTTGEGGMAVAADRGVYARLRRLRDGSSDGTTSRLFSPLSDVAAALGLSQLARYDLGVERRALQAAGYFEHLSPVIGPSLPALGADRTMWFRFPLRVAGGLAAWQSAFAGRGIHVRQGVDELLHRRLGLPDEAYPRAVAFFAATLSLPIYPALDDQDHARCAAAAAAILTAGGAGR